MVLYQSLRPMEEADLCSFLSGYGFVIVDECHHAGAGGFGDVLAHIRAKHVIGLTATLRREDGLDRVQELFKTGRKVLLLTSHREQLEYFEQELAETKDHYVLSSNMKPEERTAQRVALQALSEDSARIVITTGQIAGEEFDHAPLDTLVLALPVRGEQVLTQYVGRVIREMNAKHSVLLIDVVDAGIPVCERQWMRRQKFYRSRKVIFSGEEDSTLFSGEC